LSKPTKFELAFTTVLGTGFFPIAPATAGSAATCVILWFVPQTMQYPWLLLIVPLFLLGVVLASRAEEVYGHDAGPIVIDEFVGQWITLLAVPHTIKGYVVAFFLFRLLDIWKPLGIRASQKAPRGWGVMVDDLLAGILGVVILLFGQKVAGSLL
jgi:phosphatidylglycerophosphatase A